MKIVVNTRNLQAESLSGVQRYTSEILNNVGKFGIKQVEPRKKLSAIHGHLWEQMILPFHCTGDLLWSPANTGPIIKRNQILTIHDVATLDHPEWFEKKFALWYRWLIPQLARRVKHIITVSEFSKHRIMLHTGVSHQKITVIPLAADNRFRLHTESERESLRSSLNLPRRFVLSVGSIEPRKNLAGLLAAWEGWEGRPNDLNLVISGTSNKVFNDPNVSYVPENVRFIGRVSDESLPALYSTAEAFVYPSFYEGFGLPPLEAMASGTAVVSSGTTSLREVVGESALVINPHDPQTIVNALDLLFREQGYREKLAQEGYLRAKGFSWKRTSEMTNELLRRFV
ncbi:glycosyltransferase family 4 protein [Deinococcus wulumuqiensis]|uniref:glycosyltransferase family 4 protein n=1 Tax=Deinococcus wulumuqiensis TaxID=980427 RepID=UPI00242CFEBD|nr:glycosyltransferase family 1 protein [Deinococcus wulumuqiensis]